jgi:vacuolar protein sorting-associated protein VTA1
MTLGPHEITKAQKLCKFASSALEYQDVQGAVEYLEKAMRLLKTGKEEG